MATGKVRIFELAKELGLSSKDLIGLFERLGFEAKNQLSVVEPPIAELVRGVLLGGAGAKMKASGGGTAVAEPPAAAPPAPPAARTTKPRTPAPAATPVADEPVQTLKPVASVPKRTKAADAAAAPEEVAAGAPVAASPVAPAAVRTTPTAPATPVAEAPSAAASVVPAEPIAPAAVAASVATPDAPAAPPVPAPQSSPPPSGTGSVPRPSSPAPRIVANPAPRIVGTPRPVVGSRPAPGTAPLRPRPPQIDNSPVPTLRPVPAGQSSIVKPRTPDEVAPPDGATGPGMATGMPGRPGVAPRPGQPMPPGQGNFRPLAPGQQPPRPGMPGAPGAPIQNRRPVGNGAFRALTPPGVGGPPRPFTPRPPGAPGAPIQQGPSPSSGSGRGGGGRGRHDGGGAKKDRETEMLLEKERRRKKSQGLYEAPSPTAHMETIEKFGFNAVIKEAGEEVVVEQEEDRPELLTPRPPVITVLGHVDHGKTSLLDRIRSANVASGEAGGITQRIGAYTIDHGDQKLTFIDTPGHEAFTAMRARGAKVTDVAILVVAADDGVMPQTREAISHIKAAGVPIVVAINKMDREDASPDRVKSQLAEEGLQPADWGGKVEMIPVSARTGLGIEQLLETVLLEAELRELKANKQRRAQGVVIESALDKGRGAVATVLVQNGTLRTGDVVVVGGAFGKIRALVDDKGKQVKKAGPSIPVEIMGLSEVPSAGDTLMVVSDERVAREAAAKRAVRRKDVQIAATNGPRMSLENFMALGASGGKKSLNLILKADGNGAVEALRARVEGLSGEEVDIRVILAGVGAITPNDVNLASASNAVLIGFNIRTDETVKRLSENEQVDIRFYNVIYDVENDLKKAMLGMLAPKYREVILGRAEVREVFKVSKVGTIAGCYVQSGKLTRNAKVRIVRDSAVVFESELESLRRFKDDVKEVAENYECGVQIARYSDLKAGDTIEAYASELVAPEPIPA
jgi:translation initiation factor IF-2